MGDSEVFPAMATIVSARTPVRDRDRHDGLGFDNRRYELEPHTDLQRDRAGCAREVEQEEVRSGDILLVQQVVDVEL